MFQVIVIFDLQRCMLNLLKIFQKWSLLNRMLGMLACSHVCVLTCLACLHACVLGVFACLRPGMLGMFVCLCACMSVLCLRASYDVCLACLPLMYPCFCLIIYFVCINQGFAIKRKLLIYANFS